jgi:hypothetical protein
MKIKIYRNAIFPLMLPVVFKQGIQEPMDQCQASTLTYFSTCPFGQLTTKSICPTQSFSCPKKLIKITKTRE